MKDVSFAKLYELKKYKDLFDFKSIECIVALISTIVFEGIIIVWSLHQNCNDIVESMGSIVDGIGIAFIGFLGFIVTGLAILTGAISSKIVKRLQIRNKMKALDRILLSFYLLGLVSAFIVLGSLLLHFVIALPVNSNIIAVIIVSGIYSYFTVYAVFYAVKLIGNCLELFIIINEMQIVAEDDNFKYKMKYNDYRIMALEKLGLSTTSSETVEIYRNTIYELINLDNTETNEKNVYIDMLKKQFGENN